MWFFHKSNPKLMRSSTYRKKYFDHQKGIRGKFYFCPYCGKVMWNKRKMEVDHIVSVQRAKTSRKLRKRFSSFDQGVNDISNLTVCCSRCNRRKGKKAGRWILLGRYGVYFMPMVRYLCILLYVSLAVVLLLYMGNIQSMIQKLL